MISPVRRALAATAALAAAAITLAGCTGSSGGHHASASPSRSANGHATAIDPKKLAATLRSGLAPATSAHLNVATRIAGETIHGSGDVRLRQGAISAADLTQSLPSGLGTIRVIQAGGTSYAKLPPSLAAGSKPWVRLSTSSGNPVVSQVAGVVAPILAIASPDSVVAFAGAASSATRVGRGTAGGVPATHYTLVVDPKRLPASLPASVRGTSAASIPVDLWVDSHGRPVQVAGPLTISGERVTPRITITDYDAPVSVSAPPADEVGSG